MKAPTKDPPAGNSRMETLDCYRAIAALLVVAYHGVDAVAKEKYFGADPFRGFFRFGGRGVDLFFVLSGFIIAYVHWKDIGRKERIPSYFVKRFIRVYPILWLVAVPFIISSFTMKSEYVPAALGARVEAVAGSLILLPTCEDPLPIVVWTLKHEALFYLLFALVIWRPRLGGGILAIWGCFCIYHTSSGLGGHCLINFALNLYNVEFLLGVVCGVAARTMRVPIPRVVCLSGAVLFIVSGALYDPPPKVAAFGHYTTGTHFLEFGLAAALIVLGLSEINKRQIVSPPRSMVVLGAASYSIYLVHLPAISLGSKLLKGASRYVMISPLLAFIGVSIMGVLAGVCLHVFAEIPLLRVLRNRLLSDRQNRAARATNQHPAS